MKKKRIAIIVAAALAAAAVFFVWVLPAMLGSELPTDAEVGDYITYGRYWQQDGAVSQMQPTPIEWLVLDRQGDRILVVSRYVLADRSVFEYPTNTLGAPMRDPITWENSTLREWLNDDFLAAAFNADELAHIPTVTVLADKNPEHDRDPGGNTEDKLFLLSLSEVEKYFPTREERICDATDRVFRGTPGETTGSSYGWWVRTPGAGNRNFLWINLHGNVDLDGQNDVFESGVRPAMWLDLSADRAKTEAPK